MCCTGPQLLASPFKSSRGLLVTWVSYSLCDSFSTQVFVAICCCTPPPRWRLAHWLLLAAHPFMLASVHAGTFLPLVSWHLPLVSATLILCQYGMLCPAQTLELLPMSCGSHGSSCVWITAQMFAVYPGLPHVISVTSDSLAGRCSGRHHRPGPWHNAAVHWAVQHRLGVRVPHSNVCAAHEDNCSSSAGSTR
jgi:hypothetical protein